MNFATNWQERISVDPGVCQGEACINGTQILVSEIMDRLADEQSWQKVLESYPSLHSEDVRAVLAYSLAKSRSVEGKFQKWLILCQRGFMTAEMLIRECTFEIIEQERTNDAFLLMQPIVEQHQAAWNRFLNRIRSENYEISPFFIGPGLSDDQRIEFHAKLKAFDQVT